MVQGEVAERSRRSVHRCIANSVQIVLSVCGHSIRAHAVEYIMISRTKNGAGNNLRKVKVKTGKRLQKLMKDPTLEGRDENKVGRIPEKFAPVD
jgi:hypothetical protein